MAKFEISKQHHLVSAIIIKSEFIKSNPKTTFYQDYEKFVTEKIKTELYSNIDKKKYIVILASMKLFTSLLYNYTSIK